ncbi:hypothetical protein PAMP_008795 [Pampus punctatissimus]
MGLFDRGVQMLLTTVGAFAAFSLMTIAVGTDYWLYSRGVCKTKSMSENETSKKNEEAATQRLLSYTPSVLIAAENTDCGLAAQAHTSSSQSGHSAALRLHSGYRMRETESGRHGSKRRTLAMDGVHFALACLSLELR